MSLFKYFSLSIRDCPKLEDVAQQLSLRFKTIRFSPASVLNDPFEFLPDTSIIDTQEFFELLKPHYISEIKAKQPNLNDEEIYEIAQQKFKNNSSIRKQEALKEFLDLRPARILCLSKIAPDDPEALLLWSHYTENHTGMVLEFDDAHTWIQQHAHKQGESHDYKEVQYHTKRAGWNGLAPNDEFLFRKSKCWIYEDEVRLIRFVGDKDFDTSKVDALIKYPPEMLLSVTLGINNVQEKEVCEALATNRELSHVILYKSELHPDEYKLMLKKLPR
jgi:hypothetical protein